MLFRSSWLQPPPGPRDGCDVFHDLAGALSSRPVRSECPTIAEPAPLFVPLAEEGWLTHAATELIAREYLFPLKLKKIDTLVLGCTHYPILEQVILTVRLLTNWNSRRIAAEFGRPALEQHRVDAPDRHREQDPCVASGKLEVRKRARVEGYEVAGKTGTAQKYTPQGYVSEYRASFIGYLPAEKPALFDLPFDESLQRARKRDSEDTSGEEAEERVTVLCPCGGSYRKADWQSAPHRLRIIHGADLPSGWAGKPHALYQAAASARGAWRLPIPPSRAPRAPRAP